jgi:hypothetical protein
MSHDDHDEMHKPEETEQRLRKILRGAFSGPPTPLKAVPTRHGQKRAATKPSRSPKAKNRIVSPATQK